MAKKQPLLQLGKWQIVALFTVLVVIAMVTQQDAVPSGLAKYDRPEFSVNYPTDWLIIEDSGEVMFAPQEYSLTMFSNLVIQYAPYDRGADELLENTLNSWNANGKVTKLSQSGSAETAGAEWTQVMKNGLFVHGVANAVVKNGNMYLISFGSDEPSFEENKWVFEEAKNSFKVKA